MAATAFYLGFNIINLAMMCEAASGLPHRQRAAGVGAMQTILSGIVRDATRLRLDATALPDPEQPEALLDPDYLTELKSEILQFGNLCERLLSKSR